MQPLALAGANPIKHRPALKLVKTKDLSRDDWLTVRKQGIGSSDAAASVGLNPYQSPLELWLIKTGRDGGLVSRNNQLDLATLDWRNECPCFRPVLIQETADIQGQDISDLDKLSDVQSPIT